MIPPPPPSIGSPKVLSDTERSRFWIKKTGNANRVLLSPGEIVRMNNENLGRQDLYLCRVAGMKQEWDRMEVLALLNEDWQGFGESEQPRYGRLGYPLGRDFWSGLKENMNQSSLEERVRIRFGLIVRRTDIRVFPTDETSLTAPHNDGFDQFQHSGLAPGSLVGTYHRSKDGLWTYVQASFIRGWIRTADIAISAKGKDALDYEEARDRLVVTGSMVKVWKDPTFDQAIFSAQMGTPFPILGRDPYVVRIPSREVDGRLTFRRGYIRPGEDVHVGFLPYTPTNMAGQAFKMLGQPYGWGEMGGGRDCSRFIMDAFASFGIIMPRNSKFQAMLGIDLGQVQGDRLEAKKEILDRATPLATLLRLPGHIMLYLGSHRGRYYVIHSIWGIQEAGPSGPVFKKVGRVAVSNLDLGKSGPNGSLLERLTDIRFIGPE